MLDFVLVFRLMPPQLRRLDREGQNVSRKSLASTLAAATLISAMVAFASPVPVAAADPDADPTAAPSIQYQEALAHAREVYHFKPGGIVNVPYRPRPSDTYGVDGGSPVALPAAAGSGVAAPNLGATAAPSASANILRREVYGFLPYWTLGSTSLNYATLSTVAYFGIGLNVNLSNPADPAIGSLDKSGSGWDGWVSDTMSGIINSAHAAGTRVALTIESFAWDSSGAAYQSQILGSDANRVTTARAIAAEVARRGVDGVNLDFEPIASGQKSNFPIFVHELRTELDKIHTGYELTFCANGSGGSYDLPNLFSPGGADAVFIMGYDLRGGSPAKTGSIDPLVSDNNTYTLSSITHYFLTHGASPSTTILGLPWYGHAWSVGTDPPVVNAKPASIATYGPPATGVYYSKAASLAAQDPATTPCNDVPNEPNPCVTGEQYDPIEDTAWVAYYGSYGGTSPTWRELYYDNARSLGAKCDAIDSWNLRGVGIWALGYDSNGGNGDLTNEIAVKFLSIEKPATYKAIEPVRLVDTRIGNGLEGKFFGATPRSFLIAGRRGIPASATAVTGNLTVVNPSAGWAVYLGPDQTTSPTSSTINFNAGQTTSNGVTVALGSGGTLWATYMSFRGSTTDLVFDVTGYFVADATGSTYHSLSPQRLLDTRSGTGLTGKFIAGTPRAIQVAGAGAVPLNAVAVTGNLTVANPTYGWAIYAGTTSQASPPTSAVNFLKGQAASNNVTLALDSKGRLWATFLSLPGQTTDVVFDVTGYFTADATGSRFVPMTPFRLLDTRSNLGLSGKFYANTSRSLAAAGKGGVAYDAAGITGNLTVVNETNGWAGYVGPLPVNKPSSSTINFVRGDVKANGFAAQTSASGGIGVTYISTAGSATDFVIDVTGYFAP